MSGSPTLLPIDELNALPRAAFADALRPLFESAPPLADALYAARPFESYARLLAHAEATLATLDEAQQIAVINAHPRIGADPSHLSALSRREQGYGSAATHDAERLAQLQRDLAALNDAYEQQFGFRFLVFVNRRPRDVILGVLRERIGNARDAEMQTALHDMLAIARDRLATLGGQ